MNPKSKYAIPIILDDLLVSARRMAALMGFETCDFLYALDLAVFAQHYMSLPEFKRTKEDFLKVIQDRHEIIMKSYDSGFFSAMEEMDKMRAKNAFLNTVSITSGAKEGESVRRDTLGAKEGGR